MHVSALPESVVAADHDLSAVHPQTEFAHGYRTGRVGVKKEADDCRLGQGIELPIDLLSERQIFSCLVNVGILLAAARIVNGDG